MSRRPARASVTDPSNMDLHVQCILAGIAACCALSAAESVQESVFAHTEAGWVCGGYAPEGDYAYFLGVPYAKQPLGELRFKELQAPEPWSGCRLAREVGPVCPQRDVFYGPLMNPSIPQSEECIHANVYVPLNSLPSRSRERRPLLPVLVFVHGGGFNFGSGNPDVYGPQYLIKKNVVVITFNYRLGVFGFLSLNSTSVPGNAGLRDIVTLLRWVQRNAVAFGGDPRDVTVGGQSAGAAAVHLLTLSQAAKGLFKRAILMSGVASRGFFTTSPIYAQTLTKLFLDYLGIDGSDPEEVHRKLVALPLEKIMEAHNQIQDDTGVVTFTPVVESEHPGVKRILDEDPDVLQMQGRGKDIPVLMGFTNSECQAFRPRFTEIDIVQRIQNSSLLMLPPGVIYTTMPSELPSKIASIQNEYFSESLDMETFLSSCSDSYFIYPTLKTAEVRAANKGAPVFLYRFAYNLANNSVLKRALNLDFFGAGHTEDMLSVFRANHALGNMVETPAERDIISQMTTYVTNFMRHINPTPSIEGLQWVPVTAVKTTRQAPYNNIVNYEEPDQWAGYHRMMKFFDTIYNPAR